MNIPTIKYNEQEKTLPQEGKHIIAHYDDTGIIVYQAFNKQIANYATSHQKFGGNHYRFTRMTWIKPNFLWMMYRAGWATKENQERILAIKITHEGFLQILGNAIPSTYNSKQYPERESWKEQLKKSNVRLQWDPDHDPFGNKHTRKAIQLGIRNTTLETFNNLWIQSIEDITPFVETERQKLNKTLLPDLNVPTEKIYPIRDEMIQQQLNI